MQQENRYILRDMERFESITGTLAEQEIRSRHKVLDLEVTESNRYISQKLKIPIASKILYFRKLRLIGGVPKSIERTYVLYDKVRGIEKEDLEGNSFYRILNQRYGYVYRKNEEEILIVEAGEEEKRLLECDDQELMMIKGTTYNEGPEPFEYFEIVAVSDLYEFRSVTIL